MTSALQLFGGTKIASPSSYTISRGLFRLDASFYSADSADAQAVLDQSGVPLERLDKYADVHCSGVRTRVFVDAPQGIPFLTGSNLDTTSDDEFKYISRVLTRNISRETLLRNDILISSAGTVGKGDFVHRNHEGRLASQDVIRVRLTSTSIPAGYLYAFVTSDVARRLLTAQPAGSVIVRLYEENLQTLTIPRLPDAVEGKVAELITASFDARADAAALLHEAENAVLTSNDLPCLPVELTKYSSERDASVIALGSRAFRELDGIYSCYRLDAHFYNPVAQCVTKNINGCGRRIRKLGDIASVIFTGGRLKRNYVESNHGVPFLSGRNIIQTRPTGLKFLSNIQIDDANILLLKPASILVTRSGTIGRTCFVWNNYENYAASEDILRVLANDSEIDAGYLYAFMSSRYGHEQILRHRHGSVIDHIADHQLEQILVPCPSETQQTMVGEMVRKAYAKRAEAIRLEDDAQATLMENLGIVSSPVGEPECS